MPSEHSGSTAVSTALSICIASLVASCERSPTANGGELRAPTYTVEGYRSVQEREGFATLADTSYGILLSDDFVENLRSLSTAYPVVFARRSAQDVGIDHIVNVLSGADRSARYVGVVFDLSEDPSGEFSGDFTGTADQGFRARVFVGDVVMEWFGSDDVVERSCAVNILAHEISHTVSRSRWRFRKAFEDTRFGDPGIEGRDGRGTPVASYLIGSVAQCTYLQQEGRIPDWGVPDCVEVFGVRAFNSERCRYFTQEEPVQLQAELPSPAEGL